MNILVLSDSHGNISNMEEAVEREKPDMILHLGGLLAGCGTAGGTVSGHSHGARSRKL